jgi:hypothetical protein
MRISLHSTPRPPSIEQDAADLATLEAQITQLTASPDFQVWSKRMSALLAQSPKREIYFVAQ